MSAPNLWSPGQAVAVRVVIGGVLGVLLLGVLGAFATNPRPQLALAAVCVAGALVLGLLLPSRMPSPFHPEGSAGSYLRSAGLALGVVALVALGGWLFATTPI